MKNESKKFLKSLGWVFAWALAFSMAVGYIALLVEFPRFVLPLTFLIFLVILAWENRKKYCEYFDEFHEVMKKKISKMRRKK
jgi:hypothetical protein